MRKKAERLLALMMAVLLLCGVMTQTASAYTWGGENTRTITVTTKANYFYPGSSSITLKQDKVTETFVKLTNKKKSKTKKAYGKYTISYEAVSGKYAGKHKKTNISWNDKSIKLNLKPDTTYKVTVSYISNDVINGHLNAPLGYTHYDCDGHSWEVSSVWKVSNYY